MRAVVKPRWQGLAVSRKVLRQSVSYIDPARHGVRHMAQMERSEYIGL